MSTVLICLLASILCQSQAQFDRVPDQVDSLLAAGEKDFDIRIGSGVFFYSDGFLSFDGVKDGRVSISGDDCFLIAAGEPDIYRYESGYVDIGKLSSVDVWNPVRGAGFWPLPAFLRGGGVYRIPCNEPDLSRQKAAEEGWTIILSQWFVGAEYPVLEIRNGWLYFTRHKKYRTRMWSELRFGRCLPRYILCGPGRTEGLYGCSASQFLSVSESSFEEFTLSGIKFLGNGCGDDLILFSGVRSEKISIDSCSFQGLRTRAITAESTNNIIVASCDFSDNYRRCVGVDNQCENISISHNRFFRNGLQLTNDPVVDCKGGNFNISDNYFEDFTYSAIGVGTHFTLPSEFGTSGVVEQNEICLSEAFRKSPARMLIDSGAIYVWTNNNSLIIRDNYIHDIAGPHGNRGILCDDGSRNVSIYNNRILRIEGSYCIDYRRVHRVIRGTDGLPIRLSEGGEVYDNILDGKCRISKSVLR